MWGKAKASNPILLIVKNQKQADLMNRTLDPEHIQVISAIASSGQGKRFSAIFNTVRVTDYDTEVERMIFEQWMKETLPTKFDSDHAKQHKYKVHDLF